MDAEAAPLYDRILHARAEALLRCAVRDGFARIAEQEQTPLLVVARDSSRHERWLHGTGAGFMAAVAGELEPLAAGCLLVVHASPRALVGTALTVTGRSARAFALDATDRRVGRPRVVFGREEDPTGVAAEVALALFDTLRRSGRSWV